MVKRFPSCPAVDSALVETRIRFGFREGVKLTEADHEAASRFDVEAHIRQYEKDTQMQLTLKNARRLDGVIREKIQSILIEAHSVHQVAVSTTDDLSAKLAQAQQRVVETNHTYAGLSKIRHQIRRDIEVANEKAGINALMNEEACIREMIQFIETNSRSYSGNRECMSAERIKAIEAKLQNMRKAAESGSEAAYGNDTVQVGSIMNDAYADELELETRRLYTALNDIKDRCAFMNSDPKNTVSLAANDVEFLKKHRLL